MFQEVSISTKANIQGTDGLEEDLCHRYSNWLTMVPFSLCQKIIYSLQHLIYRLDQLPTYTLYGLLYFSLYN